MTFPSSLFSTANNFCDFKKFADYIKRFISVQDTLYFIFSIKKYAFMPHFPQIAFHFVWAVCSHIYSPEISHCALNTPFIVYHVVFRKLFFVHPIFMYRIKISTTSVLMQINSWCYNDSLYLPIFPLFGMPSWIVYDFMIGFYDWIVYDFLRSRLVRF